MSAARTDALELGWYLQVEELINVPPERACIAGAVSTSGGGAGRFLAFGRDGAEAAENGAAVLRGIVKRGEPWPEQDSG